jgi:hypothetical protein
VLDAPLGHKDDAWSLDHVDTLSLCVADSPCPDEILMVMASADSGGFNARFGWPPARP